MPKRSTAIALGGVLTIAVAGAGASLAFVNAQPADKVDICHATSSTGNPYVQNTVDVNSADLSGHEDHTGPLYEEGMTSGWGDIIPPIPDLLPEGRNWPAGQPILENKCKLVTPSPTPTPTGTTSPTSTPATTTPAPVTPAAPTTAVTPASPQTPAQVEPPTQVEIADPGAVGTDDESTGVQPASPEQVPTSVPAGGGAARNAR